MDKDWSEIFKFENENIKKSNDVDNMLLNEDTAKNLIKMIQNIHGKVFIEDILNSKEKKRKYNKRNEVKKYYESLKNSFPKKNKKELRLMTANKFKISEKTVQRHIYN